MTESSHTQKTAQKRQQQQQLTAVTGEWQCSLPRVAIAPPRRSVGGEHEAELSARKRRLTSSCFATHCTLDWWHNTYHPARLRSARARNLSWRRTQADVCSTIRKLNKIKTPSCAACGERQTTRSPASCKQNYAWFCSWPGPRTQTRFPRGGPLVARVAGGVYRLLCVASKWAW